MLAVKRQMPLVLVHQHAGKKAHVGTAAFENVGRRQTGQKLAGVLSTRTSS